ncbi:hypothetical protein ACSX1A_13240 [Pontibacter sp. MBLB2868]|uniref:hypothetical protein n=1 Tax=Pontibacter sp. MBLB2868 TaxID=3451555 RepID=UPI003F74FC10
MQQKLQMKRFFIIALLAIMLLQIFSKMLILLDYQLNKEYIIEFLCINRDKPQLKCEGKCHLSKKLKAQAAAEKRNEKQSQKQEVQLILFCQALFAVPSIIPETEDLHFAGYLPGYLAEGHQTIFHPPKV